MHAQSLQEAMELVECADLWSKQAAKGSAVPIQKKMLKKETKKATGEKVLVVLVLWSVVHLQVCTRTDTKRKQEPNQENHYTML